MSNDWIKYVFDDPSTHPEKNRPLWYYFEYVGVHLGQYYGDWTFAGKNGFLGEDVTHWQYDAGQDKPLPPNRQERQQ